jgi:hypothetical protein
MCRLSAINMDVAHIVLELASTSAWCQTTCKCCIYPFLVIFHTCHASSNDDDGAFARWCSEHLGMDGSGNAKVDVAMTVQEVPCDCHVRAMLLPDASCCVCLGQPPSSAVAHSVAP